MVAWCLNNCGRVTQKDYLVTSPPKNLQKSYYKGYSTIWIAAEELFKGVTWLINYLETCKIITKEYLATHKEVSQKITKRLGGKARGVHCTKHV